MYEIKRPTGCTCLFYTYKKISNKINANTYQTKLVQWLQKVGCLKKRGMNSWLFTLCTFCLRAPLRARPAKPLPLLSIAFFFSVRFQFWLSITCNGSSMKKLTRNLAMLHMKLQLDFQPVIHLPWQQILPLFSKLPKPSDY